MRVTGRDAMVAGMAPELLPGDWVFATDPSPEARARAVATIAEAEGLSAILPADLGPSDAPRMRRITLNVHSDLEGVGLTAAVAGALAAEGIACNMVAGHHHDHAFVPARDAARALRILRALSAGAA
ncbi:ACT domain-containing protein [Jannaschia ovalis]|uniref:ACT domain-containing protein n=1 Tax=Jannaschia ovalis TaxID=3038773 RepID=A0ABY8LCG4_9RHOB|nr:ACT domain-containing protein [Jannaschia sp. GRR-S6-38]WGH77970.1 ACT domain-containing protein [Jannaschia sp. GRR-S6-38]